MKKRVIYYISILFFITGLAAFKADNFIVLPDEPLPFKPHGYYIAAVTDDRPAKSPVAQVVTLSADKKTAVQSADLQGGTLSAVRGYISRNLDKDASQRPVIVSIKEFKLTETSLPGNRVDGQVKLVLSFGLQKDYGFERLVDYRGGLHYIRPVSNSALAATQLRDCLKNGITYFNNWMKANTGTNIKLAQKVTFKFTDYAEPNENDTVYYSPKRPLVWDDFRATTPPSGPYAAMVIPAFGYDEQHEVVNGAIRVKLSMKVYLAKSASWVSGGGQTSYALNHEQRHFDITRIIARQFQQKVLNAGLTPDTWEAFIGMQYLDSYRDMHAMQTAYDSETAHGRNHSAQAEWNRRIDKLLGEGADTGLSR
ncbi:hypothetical protein EOD41_13435 [Mucilaginibacter limnophilus]|uniref:DUF922 domain-containing protein n=1 Tax=Mucilaginibacter limnophilus TaxID=1932778 RepID=A0A437MS74_9SPHI|nr:hypothetical protein [Mucilaginibacter limnophilus]RVU00474.1 hypothetical protein EOD41_13435 [Mucilaginibacter limnophilus]